MRGALLIAIAVVAVVLAVLRVALPRGSSGPTPRELAAEWFEASAAQGASRSAISVEPIFTDVAIRLGIDLVHDNAAHGSFRLPEEMGPGVGLLDIEGDGDLDLFAAGGGALEPAEGPGQSCRLFRNDGDHFTDVTERSGAGIQGPAYGVACADYDDDGDVDIFVTRLGENALLRNDGQGRFTEVGGEMGVADDGFGASAVFFDYDRDGRLDLYVTNYVDWSPARETACYTIFGERDYCNPVVYGAPSLDRLYHNEGGGRMRDVSDAAGIASERGNGLGVVASDFDGDGWPDLYVANDQTPAFLWMNRGDGTFENRAIIRGCAYDGRGVAIAGMGVASEDLDGDLDADLLVTNINDQSHLVLENDQGLFQDVSLRLGMGTFSIPATSFGVVLFDQDLDGALDGFFANGAVNSNNPMPIGDNPYAQPDQFARLVDGRFVATPTGLLLGDVGRGAAGGDLDSDGDVDLVVSNNGGPVQVLLNIQKTARSWLAVDARTGPGDRAAIGAEVIVTTGGRSQWRSVQPQKSYLCSSDPRVHFGLGDAKRVEEVLVRWPDGTSTVRRDVPVNQVLIIRAEEAP